ncbi:hypothetical protein AVEN_205541-1 [Araneus ventricosus]|uniref:Uncharacterized protein n=1 Tax=Araneus ventricosus TaxID=182803 RepID=A0A4Y2VD24_ARAVE|nr:hypothetical protein AVEN_205541-1 [Araneus ventricosus]
MGSCPVLNCASSLSGRKKSLAESETASCTGMDTESMDEEKNPDTASCRERVTTQGFPDGNPQKSRKDYFISSKTQKHAYKTGNKYLPLLAEEKLPGIYKFEALSD